MNYVVGNDEGTYIVDVARQAVCSDIDNAKIFNDAGKAARTAQSIQKVIPNAKCIPIRIVNTIPVLEDKNISDDIGKYMYSLSEIASKVNAHLKDELQKLSECDLVQNDIEHYIELKNFNACEGYKLADMLSICRKKRRTIKDNIIKLQKIKSFLSDSGVLCTLADEIQKVGTDKQYSPRKLGALFNEKNFTLPEDAVSVTNE